MNTAAPAIPTVESLMAQAREVFGQDRPGFIVYDCPKAVYHAAPAMSSGVLRAGRETIAHARHAFMNPKPPSDAMDLGSLTDTLVLEPDRVAERFMVVPAFPKLNSNAGKAAWAEMEAAADGRTIVDQADMDAATAMRDALLAHPQCSRWLANPGHAQAVVFWWDAETGMLCKAMLDRFIPGVIALDLKSSREPGPRGFKSACKKFGYTMQIPWYLEGFEVATGGSTPFGFAVVGNEAPHLAAAYTLPDEVMAAGRQSNHNILRAFAASQKSGDWPGYSPHVEELAFNDWEVFVEGPNAPVDANVDDHPF